MQGICYDKSKNKFKAYADVFGSRIYLGSAFTSAAAASNARLDFLNSIFCSQYPLITFIRFKFDTSFNSALAYIASAIKPYAYSASGMNFPNFVINSITSVDDRSGGEVEKGMDGRVASVHPIPISTARSILLSPKLPPHLADIIFGRNSISTTRNKYNLRYEDISSSLKSLASTLDMN